MDDNELEYRLPAKVLMNRLSIREFVQWLIFFGLIYICFNLLPFNFPIRLVIGVSLAMFAALFIHAPINGLGGIEWLFIWIRFRLEKGNHSTVPPLSLSLVYSRMPTIQVTKRIEGLEVLTNEEISKAINEYPDLSDKELL